LPHCANSGKIVTAHQRGTLLIFLFSYDDMNE
jgi:hypothetical protein